MADMEGLAGRRRKAGDLFDVGMTRAEVARQLGVSRESAGRWYNIWLEGGTDALGAVGRRGRAARLTDSDLAPVKKALSHAGASPGSQDSPWTLRQVGSVIERVTGVSYHPGHVWRIAKRLGWSIPQGAGGDREAANKSDKQSHTGSSDSGHKKSAICHVFARYIWASLTTPLGWRLARAQKDPNDGGRSADEPRAATLSLSPLHELVVSVLARTRDLAVQARNLW